MPIPDEYKKYQMVHFHVPPAMLREMDEVAKDEHRTRADLFRESLRDYLVKYRWRKAQETEAQRRALIDKQQIINGEANNA